MSSVTVPRRSEGIRPSGPRTRPSLGVIDLMRAGVHRMVVALNRLLIICKEFQSHYIDPRQVIRTPSINSTPPTMWAPAFLASSAWRPSANTRTLSSTLALASRGRLTRPLGTVTPFLISVLTESSYAEAGKATSTA